jgi:molecular chaperone HscA
MRADGDLLEDHEHTAIEQAITATIDAVSSQNTRAINEAVNRLNQITEPFAGRRMDRNVQRALKGQNIGEL